MREWLICGACLAALVTATTSRQDQDPMQDLARKYVELALGLGAHDKDYIDAYYGPGELKQQAEAAKLDLSAIGTESEVIGGQAVKAQAPARVEEALQG